MADAPASPTPTTKLLKSQLRKELRQRRQSLTVAQQAQASASALRHLLQYPPFTRGDHIALYIAADGEIDPFPITQYLWRGGKSCYLPALRPTDSRELRFVEFTSDSELLTNQFGIHEPDQRKARELPSHLLDVVLMPLVGFDRAGARLGMGGGFYDTTFAFKHSKPHGQPLLIGLAHSCQEVDRLPVDSWDVPLTAIVTEQELLVVIHLP